MKRIFVVGLLLMLFCVGCGAGKTHVILTFDNVIAAATETRKGVDAFNDAVKAETASRQEALVGAVGEGIVDLATKGELSVEEAEVLAASVMEAIRLHLANYTEQERRRSKLYDITIDNINYIIEICEQGKKFEIYRADIGAQWKDYLESTGRSAIPSVE